MHLLFNTSLAVNYHSQSQISRVLTENWVLENAYCPNCGNSKLNNFDNNKPVADFFCNSCREEYELKSKNGKLGNKIVDGAYNSMIDRINSDNNPNLFFLSYNKSNWEIKDFIIVPKYYFISDFIEKRKPLSSTARRAGWIGCNIILGKIPSNGQIYLVRDSKEVDKSNVIAEWKNTEFLRDCNHKSRGWLIDIMNCIDSISENQFTLNQMYSFEKYLKNKHADNNFIKDKIRQQLQILRDKGVIDFISRGIYRKIKG